MTHSEQHDDAIRHPQPEAAATDGHAAAAQAQVHEDSEAIRREAARARATTPREVSEKTVAEIAAEAEARARR
jgi:hypothetical protein